MRIHIIVTLCNILHVIGEEFDIINESLGDLQIHSSVGRLPIKYMPLSERDLEASEIAANVIDFIQLVPGLDPLSRKILPPVGIDVPFLFLSGTVYMKNFVLAGVKQLELNSLELRLVNYRLDLNITVPEVKFEGDFYLQASISFIPVVFKCHISVILEKIDILVSAGSRKVQAAPPVGEALQIDSAAINVNIQNIVFNLTNMVTGGEEEEVGVPIIQLFNGRKSSGMPFDRLLKTALKIANKKLLNVSIDVFKEYLELQ